MSYCFGCGRLRDTYDGWCKECIRDEYVRRHHKVPYDDPPRRPLIQKDLNGKIIRVISDGEIDELI